MGQGSMTPKSGGGRVLTRWLKSLGVGILTIIAWITL